jgi:hypothetical protein
MKKLVYLLIFAFVITSGCTKDSLSDENVFLKKKSTQCVIVPAKCWFTTVPDFSMGFVPCSPVEMEVALLRHGGMKGHLAHGGALITDLSYYNVLGCEFDYMNLTVTENIVGIHTVANGDCYTFTGQIQVDVTNGMLSGTVLVDGGTGRYDGATASLTLTGVHNFETNVATMTGEGLWTFTK